MSVLQGWHPTITLSQRVKQVLRRYTSHAGWPVRLVGGRSTDVSLPTTLDFVEDDTEHNNEEHAAKGDAERDEDDQSSA